VSLDRVASATYEGGCDVLFLGLIALLVALGFGYTAGSIAESKGHSFGLFFVLGFFFPLIGVIVAAVIGPAASDTR
jgi:hypothetical protein